MDIESKNGDFCLRDLFKKLCVSSRNEMIVNICRNEFQKRKLLIFCINIDHSMIINNLLKSNGLESAHIDGYMNSEERNSILSSFRNGEINILCNCQLLTEGFDEPSIDGIILARPTRSKALFRQMIGRGLRKFQGKKNCKIVDIVDNHKYSAGFNCLISDEHLAEIEEFKSIEDIQKHLGDERIKICEFKLVKANLFLTNEIDDLNATDSMIKYLEDNNIIFYEPLSFDEGCFMMWFNELNKEYLNGCN